LEKIRKTELMNDKEFKAKFTADNSDFNRKTKETEQRSKSFSQKMISFAKLIGAAWLFSKVIQISLLHILNLQQRELYKQVSQLITL